VLRAARRRLKLGNIVWVRRVAAPFVDAAA
jgi:hypothetical protein